MWSIAFYVAENFVHELKEMDFIGKLFQVICCVSCYLIVVLSKTISVKCTLFRDVIVYGSNNWLEFIFCSTHAMDR